MTRAGPRSRRLSAQASLADEVADALTATEKDILVDELRMLRHPIVLGVGMPFLPPTYRSLPLDLIETRRFDDCATYERYRRARS